VNPGIAGLYALFADMRAGLLDFDLVQMGTLITHRFLLRGLLFGSSDLGHVTKGQDHILRRHFSLTMGSEVLSYVLRLDYLSCVLTIASTVLIGRRCWEGWALAGINSVVVCVIGLRTEQLGFIPANVFCMVVSAINLHAWRRSNPTEGR
jgi:hypothetical protein